MPRPIIQVLASYFLGLLIGYYLVIPFHIIIALLFISASITAAAILIRKTPLLFFVLSMLALFILGMARMEAILSPSFPENHITNLITEEPLSLEGTISEPLERGSDRSRLYISLSSSYIGDEPFPVAGKLLLTIGENDTGLRYGDTIRFLAKVKRPRNFHNPGGFDYERYLAFKGVFATAFLKDAEGIIKMAEENSSFGTWIEGMREAIRETVFKNAGDSAPIMLALITGDQGEIPKDLREAFSRAGTTHILAISGEHIGIIAIISFAIILWLLKRSEWVMLRINIYKAAALLTIPLIALYSLIAGSGFSIIRAAIMGGVLLVAVLVNRRKDIPSLIASAAFLILAFEPQALFDISFQLSFASVISLAIMTPYIKKIYTGGVEEDIETRRSMVGRFSSWAVVLALISAAATIGTAPLTAYYFNRVSIISPISNLITVPVIGFIIVPLGLLASIIIPISQAVSGWLVEINSQLISLVIKLTTLLASAPVSSIRVITPNIVEISLFYIITLLFAYRNKFTNVRQFLILAITFLLLLESFYFFKPRFQDDLKITFLDVGQGESALIEFPGGKSMLIDGGGMATGDFDTGERVVAPFLWHKRVRSIDYMVLSHPNSDHYGGLQFILRNFNIGEIWESGVEEESEGYDDFRTATKKSSGLRRIMKDGDMVTVNGVMVNVLNPPEGYEPRDDRGANNGSLVLRIAFGKTSFLFTGDIEKEAEYRLLSKKDAFKSTVLKVPHHGSLTSSTVDFISMVRPESAVFSVGYKNRFGFPKDDVVRRYKDINAAIYRTDRDGAVIAISDGMNARLFKALSF